MKPNKDISDRIREAAQYMEQKPSKDAWARLEQKLEQQHTERRFSIRRFLSIAASVAVLLVAAVYLFSPKANTESTLAENASPFAVEELKSSKEADQGFYRIVEFQRTHQDRMNLPIDEGNGKKLSVAKFARTEETVK